MIFLDTWVVFLQSKIEYLSVKVRHGGELWAWWARVGISGRENKALGYCNDHGTRNDSNTI